MGTFRVSIEIGDAGGATWEPVVALVDTGATYTTVPAALLDFAAVVTVVVFAPDNAPVLLGAYALEGLRLAADPIGRRLIPVPALFLAAH